MKHQLCFLLPTLCTGLAKSFIQQQQPPPTRYVIELQNEPCTGGSNASLRLHTSNRSMPLNEQRRVAFPSMQPLQKWNKIKNPLCSHRLGWAARWGSGVRPGARSQTPNVCPQGGDGLSPALCSAAHRDFSPGRAPKELELMISNGILNGYILLFMIMQYFIWVI